MQNGFYTSCVRYLDKTVTGCETVLFDTWWTEQTNQYGQLITYYVNNHTIATSDSLYGEDTTTSFSTPQQVVALCDLSQSQLFSRWSLLGDDFTTILIPISSYQQTFGSSAEPKSGDVFQLTEFGSDRPDGRTGKMFQVTERLDEDITLINPLMSHIMWMIKAKRFEFSFEPGLSAEGVTDQVTDSSNFGRLSGGENPPTTNLYSGTDADTLVTSTVFNFASAGNKDLEYGGYIQGYY